MLPSVSWSKISPLCVGDGVGATAIAPGSAPSTENWRTAPSEEIV